MANFLSLPLLSVAESVSMSLPKSIMVSGDNVVRVNFVSSVVAVVAVVAVVVDDVRVSLHDWLVVEDIELAVVMLLSFASTLATLFHHRCCVTPDASLWTHFVGHCFFFSLNPPRFPLCPHRWPFLPKPLTLLSPVCLTLSRLISHLSQSYTILYEEGALPVTSSMRRRYALDTSFGVEKVNFLGSFLERCAVIATWYRVLK
jgi:hypothetical protein